MIARVLLHLSRVLVQCSENHGWIIRREAFLFERYVPRDEGLGSEKIERGYNQ
jgi:hypothetical protein